MNLLQELEAHAKRIFEADGGERTATMQVEVKLSPGGLTTVTYIARSGECYGSDDSQLTIAGSPAACVVEIIGKIARAGDARSRQIRRLEEQARQLGMQLQPIAAEGGGR